MQEDRLIYLYHKAVNNSISEKEREELFVLLADPAARQLYNSLFEWGAGQTEGQEDVFTEPQANALLERINKINQPRSANVFKLKTTWVAAACVTLLLGVAAYHLVTRTVPAKPAREIAQAIPQPAAKAHVMLTLSDGRQVPLDSTATEQIIEQKGTQAVNSGKGALTYTAPENHTAVTEVVFNTLTTPRGKYYKIVLPDGTRVSLNAASSLRYPTVFSDGQRKVELTGEAYFDVATDARHPFIVVTGKQTVSVLGTAFNVKAYTDEPYTKTTLVEGRIKVDPRNGTAAKVLSPGEQATLENNQLKISKTDTREDVSWMLDMFYFSDTDLHTVAHQLQRWYDIEVDYSSLPNARLYGQLPRSTPLPQLLNAIEKTSDIKLKLSNNRVLTAH
ncbi:FecR domain-containing protein [Chitinophaga sp.]|uniref:FecR domain-containing protein n=1 Tax=Chitinophaga sp. TaxID=1869181 RepID=UPI002C931683|nr:FecR domain-containing protein [Chitinophaga sp.]HWV67170.1 FecR domain-containing protein [Chitinophaga sp.]